MVMNRSWCGEEPLLFELIYNLGSNVFTHGTVLQNGILANDLNLREQTYEKRLGYELEKMNLELENLRLQGSYLSSGVLNNIASANRANSAAAFDNIQTEMAGMERDFYKNLEGLTGAPRSVASGVGSAVKNVIGFLGGRYLEGDKLCLTKLL